MADKKLVFAGSGPGSPWAEVGHATRRILANYGYEVEVARKPGPSNPVAVGGGDADLGAATYRIVLPAMRGTGPQGKTWANLRRIAFIDWPQWFAVAARRSLGVTSLSQIAEKQLPVRVLARQDAATEALFGAHGFSIADIERWGGCFYRVTIPSEEIQMGGRHSDARFPSELVKGDYLDLIAAPCWSSLGEFGTFWRQASCFMDLRFLPLGQDVMSLLQQKFDFDPVPMPAYTFEGADEDVATVGEAGMVVYCREDTPDDLVYLVAQAYDRHAHEFTRGRHHFLYNPRGSLSDDRMPMHPAALRYFRETTPGTD